MSHFTLIAGPCVIEDEAVAFLIASRCKDIAQRRDLDFVFKGSFKKANRTKLSSFATMGEQEALEILGKVGKELGVRVITDVHETTDCARAAEYVDILQIPAFLCRQTELLIAAGNTGKTVNIKKGQFMAPESMKHAMEKVQSTGNQNVWLTERGTTFGYEYLVVDMTAMPKMRRFCDKVIMDCTHSVQRPNQDGKTGGDPEMIETIAVSAMAAGATGLFLEVHPEPWKSSSDATNILQIDKLEGILEKCVRVKVAVG
ncbi:MAG: 3-deoxy-8-phosphooctulonate synthase [Bacteroidia bacterium]